MYIQQKDSVYDIQWVEGVTYGDVFHQNEVDYSKYNFEVADTAALFTLFDIYEKEARAIIDRGLVQAAYDYMLKCSHAFNLLDARGAISVTERTGYITRVRNIARAIAQAYIEQRKSLGYPLLKDEALRAKLERVEKGGGE